MVLALGRLNVAGRNGAASGVTDPSFASTKLLLGFEATNGSTTFADQSSANRGNATAFGSAQVSTAQFKYGASSLLLNGTTDYATFLDSTDWDFGTGAFTIELFVRYATVADAVFLSYRDAVGLGWRFYRTTSGLIFDAEGAPGTVGVAWTPTAGTWYHVCVDRDAGGAIRVYVDGAMLQKNAAGGGSISNPAIDLHIGRNSASAVFFFNGNMDEIRITKGVARYGSDAGFTVPTAAFPRS